MTEPAKATSRSCSMVTGLVRKADVRFAAMNLINRFGGIAQVADVGLLADLFGIEAEELVEDDGVQMAQVELALVFGQSGECGRGGLRLRTQKKRTVASDGDEGGSVLRRSVSM